MKINPQPGLFDEPTTYAPKAHTGAVDAATPIGMNLIRVSESCLAALDLDPIDSYTLEEHLVAADPAQGLRWYHYHAEARRILKCPDWKEYADAMG